MVEFVKEEPKRPRYNWQQIWDQHVEPMPVDEWQRVEISCDPVYARMRLGNVARAKKVSSVFTTRIEDGKLFVMKKGEGSGRSKRSRKRTQR